MEEEPCRNSRITNEKTVNGLSFTSVNNFVLGLFTLVSYGTPLLKVRIYGLLFWIVLFEVFLVLKRVSGNVEMCFV